MSWLGSSRYLAVDRGASVWTLVGAERVPDRGPRLMAMGVVATEDQTAAADAMRAIRQTHRVPSRAAVVLWPEPVDVGVVPIDARSQHRVTLPKAKVIRQRVAPFIRAGGQVREILLPHEAAARLVKLGGWSRACVLIMEPAAACVALVDGGAVTATYLTWLPIASTENETVRLLARYQFAARLAPHLRDAVGPADSLRMAVCGRFPDLRSAMVPIVEELDREVDVLDAALLGQTGTADAGPDETCGAQLAWAVAASA